LRLIVAAIGRLRAGPEAALIEDYAGRIRAGGRRVGLTGIEIVELEAAKGAEGAARLAREGELLKSAVPDGAISIALDERGRQLSSAEFAVLLARHVSDGAHSMAFLIGGADGLAAETRDCAALQLAFGKATWPHLLVRAMLVEQIYRAMTILAGHPYHRA
jgi:23S rRNA (pseudouridine1915-N3)-methyltransferase